MIVGINILQCLGAEKVARSIRYLFAIWPCILLNPRQKLLRYLNWEMET